MKWLAAVVFALSLVGLGVTGGQQVSVLSPGFAMRPYMPRVGMEVEFTDYSAGSPVEWLWNFGDGATSVEKDPKHTYVAAGSYTVELTVTNAEGQTASVKVEPLPAN